MSCKLSATASLAAFNVIILLALLAGVELVFGNWIRPFGVSDLKRFSIPIGLTHTFDPSLLYETGGVTSATYSRNAWGLRGSAQTLQDIDVITVGGSTTDQRYLDDAWTWQAVAEREMQALGEPLIFSNAGVDGQSTVGHAFNFQYWFPLLEGLRPRVVLFYVGINDVLRGDDRGDYDRSVDARTWRTKSALFQLYKVLRGNLRARDVGVTHGRRRPTETEFTSDGLLSEAEREALAAEITTAFLSRIHGLQQYVTDWGAVPTFLTQTALGWNADRRPPRGLRSEVRVHGRTANFADVAFLHQHLNRSLIEDCTARGVTCFDLANEVGFEAEDYYDPVHNTPSGAEKVGRYVANRIADLNRRPQISSR